MTEEVELNVIYDSYTSVSRERNPDDEWDRDDTTTSWIFHGVDLAGKHNDGDIKIKWNRPDSGFMRVYVTIVVWSTGDSFGYDDAYHAEAFSVHPTYEAAAEACRIMENAKGILTAPEKGGYDLGDGYTLDYAPWDGYFEELYGTFIVTGIV